MSFYMQGTSYCRLYSCRSSSKGKGVQQLGALVGWVSPMMFLAIPACRDVVLGES